MKYAIFSDIHGNFPALEAALTDAKKYGVDKYLFIGDYCSGYPYVNEVADALRALPNATIIAGNHEGYIRNLHQQDPATWTDKQSGIVYWCYRQLTAENREFLMNLPEMAVVSDAVGDIHLAHGRSIFFRYPNKIDYLHSSFFRRKMGETPFTHAQYLELAREAVLVRPDAVDEMRALPAGVHLFGHNHLQFHMHFEDKLFINPGSCGEALDGDTTAAYSWLEHADGAWKVTERRVAYNVEAVVTRLQTSGYADFAPAWSNLYAWVLRNGFDCIGPFLAHVNAVSAKNGENGYPASNKTWDESVATFELD